VTESNDMSSDPPTKGKVIIRTSLGPVDIELFSKESPKTCRAFIQLCQEGFYNNQNQMVFARVIKGVLVETGSSLGAEKNEDGLPFASENHGRLRFTVRGRVACVASNGASSDFFITLDKSEWLNGKHTIFGKVIGDSLFNVVRIGELDTDKHDRPYDPPEILGVDIVDNPFDDIVCRPVTKKLVTASSASDRLGHSSLQKNITSGGRGGGGGGGKRAPVLSFGGMHKLEDEDDVDNNSGTSSQTSGRLLKRSLSEATAAELMLKKRSRQDETNEHNDNDDEDYLKEQGRTGEKDAFFNKLSSIPISVEDAAAAAAARRKEEFARLKRELKAGKEKGAQSIGVSGGGSRAVLSSTSSRDVLSTCDKKMENGGSTLNNTSGQSLLQQMRDKYAKAKAVAKSNVSENTSKSARDASTLEKLSAFTNKLKTTATLGVGLPSNTSSSSSSSSSSLFTNDQAGGGLKFVRHIDDESRGLYLGVGIGGKTSSSLLPHDKRDPKVEDFVRESSSFNNMKHVESSAIKRAVSEDVSAEDLADALMREIQDEMTK